MKNIEVKILGEVELDKNGKITVVVGETSEHNHAFMDATKAIVFRAFIKTPVVPEGYETLLAVVNDDVEFSHYNVRSKELTKEHATLLLKPGIKGSVYEINQQREVNFDEEIVRVTD